MRLYSNNYPQHFRAVKKMNAVNKVTTCSAGLRSTFHVPEKRSLRYRTKKFKRSAYLPLLFTDPQLMEGTQARQDAAPEPASIPPFDGITRCMYLSL